MAGKFRHDGGVLVYHAREAPSNTRLKEILREQAKAGYTGVGIVADIQSYASYERAATPQLIRAFRGSSPEAMRARISGPGSMHSTSFVLNEVKQATGAESVSGLKGFELKFYR